MNFLKGLIGLGKKDNSLDFSKYVGEGRLFILGKTKECIFIACNISFLANKQQPFSYTVYITNLSGESAYDTNEYYFPISSKTNLRSYFQSDEDEEVMGFEWELDNGTVVCFEFDNQINDLTQADQFKEIFCKLIYETIHQAFSSDAENSEDYTDLCKDRKEYNKEKQSKEVDKLASHIAHLDISSNSQQSQKSNSSSQSSHYQQSKPIHQSRQSNVSHPGLNKSTPPYEEYKTAEVVQAPLKIVGRSKLLYRITADLVEIDPVGKASMICSDVQVAVVDHGGYDLRYEVFDRNGDIVFSRVLDSKVNYHIDPEEAIFKWVETVNDALTIYACKLKGHESDIRELKFLIARCIVEHNNKDSIHALFKKDEIDFARRLITEEIYEEDEELYQSQIKDYDDTRIEIQDAFVRTNPKDNNGKKNTGHAQAKVLDRTFVSKGSVISVYRTDDEETSLSRILDLPVVRTLSGSDIVPKKMLLHEQDSKILLLNDFDDNKVYYMDLEKGKVIQELQADGINAINDINPITKNSELSSNPCFLSLNARNIFRLDPRIYGENKIASQKIYAKSPLFSCIVAADNEHFATGSETGEIRLYKEVGQNAKNLYPGLGDPIIGLDTTKDGKWLLATTDTYLMLLPTFTISNKNGYTHSLGKEKAVPKRLQISPDDALRYGIKEIKFTIAKFNDSEKGQEKFISTSTGSYIITWILSQVLKGRTNNYEIKKINDRVVLNEYKYNRDDSVLITTLNEVRLQKIKVLTSRKR